jgi:glutathione synthase
MTVKLAVVMDPISKIHYEKDTTLAFLQEAQRRKWDLFYLEPKDLYVKDGIAFGMAKPLQVFADPSHWFALGEVNQQELTTFDIILMRKDPPFNMEYIYTTYLLEFAKNQGVLVVNNPQSLRDANEKLFAQWFPHCMPPTLVSCDGQLLHDFIQEQQDVVLKPLHSMGGGSIFRLTAKDYNINVVLEVLTDNGRQHIMAQRFLPEIVKGDKRIFLIDGEPVPYAVARLPKEGEIRGNLAAGGTAKGVELSERDFWLCSQIGETLRQKELLFVGLDVIGDYITEINVTSPTCVRELESFYPVNICAQFLDVLEAKLT